MSELDAQSNFKARKQFALMLGILIGLSAFLGLAQAQDEPFTLKGRLEESAVVVEDQYQGKVTDAATGKPLAGATVAIPGISYRFKTDAKGQYAVPRRLGRNPIIMSVEKQGYVPFSMTISESAPPTFTLGLHAQARVMILDNQLRHLGDGSYSMDSVGSGKFRAKSEGPVLRREFMLDQKTVSNNAYLQIGSILGLDTKAVHMLSGYSEEDATASPLQIVLNGHVISQIALNGDNKQIRIPKNAFYNGKNTLELKSGYHFKDNSQLDFDDMELIYVVLHL